MPKFVDLSKQNAREDLPKATEPATREGLFWVMKRACTEALNVALILGLDDLADELERAMGWSEAQRELEQKETGTEKLR